jgi:hypothetical protein
LQFQEQLALCQRHFWKSFRYSIAPAQNVGQGNGELLWISSVAAAGSTFGILRYPVPMRISPAVAMFNPVAMGIAGTEVRNLSISANGGSSVVNTLSTDVQFVTQSTAAAGTVVGHILGVQLISDAGI